jgi:DNA-binding NarL/FixJ family response regulator
MPKMRTELPLTRVLKKAIHPYRYAGLSPTRKLILEYLVKGYSLRDVHRASGLGLNNLGLSRESQELMTALTRGETAASIADDLGLSPRTVGTRVSRLRAKVAGGKGLNYLIVLWLKAINNW